jgi:hypothetical protein
VSFQTTANEKGELVKKPLINLHVTPNGCGILGCEEEGLENYGGQYPPHPDQGYYPGGPAKSQGFLAQQGEKIANFFSPKKHHSGQVPNYGPPPPVYNDAYKAPPNYHNEVPPVYHGDYKRTQQTSYNPPPPQPAYNPPPQQGYNPPPQQGYNQPQARPVKFNPQEPVVVKHEHHHYYHESQGGNSNDFNSGGQGIKFGFNGNSNNNNPNNFHNNFNNNGNQQFLGRTNNESDIEADQDHDAEFVDNNNVKRQSSLVSFGTPEQIGETDKAKEKLSSGAKESGFKFPAARSLSADRKRRSPDKEAEEETEEQEEIKAVNIELNFAQKSQTNKQKKSKEQKAEIK